MGENDREVTVIVHGQVLEDLKSNGVSNFPVVVKAALEAADEVDVAATQVVVFMDSPLFPKMKARFRQGVFSIAFPFSPIILSPPFVSFSIGEKDELWLRLTYGDDTLSLKTWPPFLLGVLAVVRVSHQSV